MAVEEPWAGTWETEAIICIPIFVSVNGDFGEKFQ